LSRSKRYSENFIETLKLCSLLETERKFECCEDFVLDQNQNRVPKSIDSCQMKLVYVSKFSWNLQDFLDVVAFRFGTFTRTSILLYETQIKFWAVLIVIAGVYCISMPMKMCHLVHGLLVLKLSTLMTTICAVERHQVLLLKDICS
jgi:hypothetical protein